MRQWDYMDSEDQANYLSNFQAPNQETVQGMFGPEPANRSYSNLGNFQVPGSGESELDREIDSFFLGFLIVRTIRQIVKHQHYIALLMLIASAVGCVLVLWNMDMTGNAAYLALGLFVTSIVALGKCMS